MTQDAQAPAGTATNAFSKLMALSGLECVAGLAEGSIARPPMAETLPFTLLPPEAGVVRLVATPEARFYNLTMTVHGGWTLTMLDTAMSLAAQTTLQAGETCPSHETSAKFVRPIIAGSGALTITGRVVSRGRTVITLEGRVEDPEGRLLAHGTSTCLIMRPQL
jgi:uncharacterized protein (TIGR00369 family)